MYVFIWPVAVSHVGNKSKDVLVGLGELTRCGRGFGREAAGKLFAPVSDGVFGHVVTRCNVFDGQIVGHFTSLAPQTLHKHNRPGQNGATKA